MKKQYQILAAVLIFTLGWTIGHWGWIYPKKITVAVIGKVQTPGIYTFPYGTRAYKAVRAAGGPTVSDSYIRYAQAAELLHDGQTIEIFGWGEIPTIAELPEPPDAPAPLEIPGLYAPGSEQ